MSRIETGGANPSINAITVFADALGGSTSAVRRYVSCLIHQAPPPGAICSDICLDEEGPLTTHCRHSWAFQLIVLQVA